VSWDPPPPEPGLDPYRVLEVHPEARPAVIEAAFTVLREMACADEADGGRELARLAWARRVLLHR
jgi:hypothetical protein